MSDRILTRCATSPAVQGGEDVNAHAPTCRTRKNAVVFFPSWGSLPYAVLGMVLALRPQRITGPGAGFFVPAVRRREVPLGTLPPPVGLGAFVSPDPRGHLFTHWSAWMLTW